VVCQTNRQMKWLRSGSHLYLLWDSTVQREDGTGIVTCDAVMVSLGRLKKNYTYLTSAVFVSKYMKLV